MSKFNTKIMKDNVELMRNARAALKGKWGLAIATFLVYMLIVGGVGFLHDIASIASIVLAGPMALGAATFSLSLARGEDARFEQIFDGLKDFVNAFATYLLMMLRIILWSLLLIIPGIIAAFSYSMTFYILSEDRTLKSKEAINASREMMDGNKLKLFYLFLRFFLLALLCILTLGIGFLFLIPYVNVTMAMFYDDVKAGKKEGEFV